jgi:hypothetical protein
MKKAAISVGVVLLLACASCRSQSGQTLRGSLYARGLRLFVAVGEQGTDGLTFEITLKNTGTSEVTAKFSSSQTFDIKVADSLGRTIWAWSHDKDFLQVFTSMALAPGESRVLPASWDLMDNVGQPVVSGPYKACAWITSDPPDPGLAAVTDITVQ